MYPDNEQSNNSRDAYGHFVLHGMYLKLTLLGVQLITVTPEALCIVMSLADRLH